MLQAKLLVSGRVQAVGYRSFVSAIAKAMGITGYAKNLENGGVEILCECESESSLESFIGKISPKRDYGLSVESISVLEKREVKNRTRNNFSSY